VAIAHRTGPRAGIAKVQTDAYNNLTKAEFDALPDATKQRITDDLKAAHAKFQDPAKKRSVEHTMGRLGIGPHPAPSNAPGGPSPIGAPHGLGAPSVAPAPRHAAPAGTTFTPGSIGTISHLGKRHDQRLADYEKLDHAQLAGLSDAQRAALHGDLMNIAAKAPSAADRKHAADLIDRLNAANPSSVAKSAAAVQAANAHGFTKTLDDIRNETDPRKIASALTAARYAATDKDHKKALDDLAGEVAGNSSHPAWLRAHAYMINDDNRNALPQSAELSMAIHTASKAPSSNGRIFATTHDLEQLLAPDKKELDRLPPVLRDAVQTRRTEALKDTFDPAHGATLQARESALVAVFGDPQGKPNFDRYDALTPEGRKVVNTGLEQHIVNKTSGVAGLDAARGSAWQSVKDTLDSKTYSPHQEAAIKAAQDSSGSALSRLSQFDRLDHASFQALPDAHKTAISLPLLSWGGGNPSPAVRQESLHLLAKFSGAYPDYSTQRHQDAVLAATIDRGFLDARQRSARYHALSGSDWHLLKPADRGLIAKDMQGLADDRSGQLGLGDRHDIQFHHDVLTGNISNYSSEQKAAYAAADPGSNVDITDRLAAYGKLDSSSFGALPAAYQDAIKSDLSIISLTHPSEHDAVMAKLDPSFVPANNLKPTSVIGSNVDPQLKAAAETLYGLHPKAHTAAHQLSTYGALKTHQFHQLNSDEQSQLLGDLSYIATTSKGTNKDKAERLINNFTPPGTPYGQPNVQAVIPPSNAVAGQVRDPNPKGTTGLLVQARDKGLSGDGWTTTPGGKRVWGKYGASGVLLRHVGPDGKERFLMVQRGPAISDPGKWQFPGGAIDSKETAYTGGTREVIEELGFKDGSLDDAAVHGHHESGIPGSTWKYTSIAATVPKQLVPDLSDPHARAETSDAKWMTREEIAQLDTGGKLLAPLAGGKLEQNVLSLFPPGAHTVGRPAPRTTRLDRLRGTPSIAVAPPKPHKTSRAKNLITDLQAEKGLSQQLKTMRKQYAGKTADDRLAAIGELQGFNDTPTVTSKAEVDRLLATGNYVEAWRGVYGSSNGTKTAADINEEMRSGPAYYGTGIFGNGYYLATDKSVARQYSDGSKNSIVRVLIPKDASTIDHAKALDGARQSYSSVPYRYNARSTTGQGSLHDEGRWAAAKGHDGIVISQHSRAPGGGATHVARAGKPAYNWLNRSVLIIQEADK
jgi:8-oxo-dGTP pyrophosphatase MutT (NUDIX family)